MGVQRKAMGDNNFFLDRRIIETKKIVMSSMHS